MKKWKNVRNPQMLAKNNLKEVLQDEQNEHPTTPWKPED